MKYLLAILLLQYSYLLTSQASIIWQKTYGGNGSEFLRGGVHPTSYGYIIAGDSESDLTGNKSIQNHGIWLIGIDSFGNELWQKGYCDYFSGLWSIVQTPDLNFIIGASSYSDSCIDKSQKSFKEDIWIIKINEFGEILWEKTFSGYENDGGARIISVNDGGYLIGASSGSQVGLSKLDSSKGAFDIWLLKLNKEGIIEWQSTIGGSDQDILTSIVEVSDGYLIGCNSLSAISGDKSVTNFGFADYWVLKIGKFGDIIWQRNFGGSACDNLYSLIETDDHFIVLAGFSRSEISGNKNTIQVGSGDWWVIKLDSLGDEIWQKNFGGVEPESEFVYLKPGNNGEFYLYGSSVSGISGNKTTLSQGSMDYWLLKINGDGNILWQHSFGGNSIDYLRSLLFENDSCFILSGQSQSVVSGDKNESSYGGSDYWVLQIKLDKLTKVGDTKESVIKLYPNPVKDFVYLDSEIEYEQVIISNAYGSKLCRIINSKQLIDLHGINSGLYILEFLSKKSNCVIRKMIIKL